MRSISTINAAIMENMECLQECSIIKVCVAFIDIKVSVSLDHGVSLHFISLLTR